MQVLLVLVLAASPLIAVAETKHDLVIEDRRIARNAAAAGNCDVVRDLGDEDRTGPTDCDRVATVPPVGLPAVQRLRPASPPISGGRFIGQIAVGYLAGAVGLVGVGAIWFWTCAWGRNPDRCGLAFAVAGATSTTLLLSVGVYGVGRSRQTTSSFSSTLLGTTVGGAVGLLTALGLSNDQPGYRARLATIAFIGAPMAGALIGFYASQRWRSSAPAVGSLLHLDRGKVSVGVPIVAHGETGGSAISLVSLVGGSF